jgi:TonB family protein
MNIRSLSAGVLVAALSLSALTPLSAAIQNAKPILQVVPSYSLELRKCGVEGEVVVGFTISATGEVQHPVVLSSTDRDLNRSTLTAVSKWRFAPAMDGGVAVSQKAVLPVAFKIPELHPAAASRIIVSDSKSASQAKNPASVY